MEAPSRADRDERRRLIPIGLAVAQLADAAGNALMPAERITAHLDHLRVPRAVQSKLQLIKVAASAGLLLGTRVPALGRVTAACLVGYYAAAVRYHLRADEHPVLALPAAAFGAAAVAALLATSRRQPAPGSTAGSA